MVKTSDTLASILPRKHSLPETVIPDITFVLVFAMLHIAQPQHVSLIGRYTRFGQAGGAVRCGPALALCRTHRAD